MTHASIALFPRFEVQGAFCNGCKAGTFHLQLVPFCIHLLATLLLVKWNSHLLPFSEKLITPKTYLFRESKRRCQEPVKGTEASDLLGLQLVLCGQLLISQLCFVVRPSLRNHSCWPPLTLGVIRGTFHSAYFDGLFFDHQNFHVEMRQFTQKSWAPGCFACGLGHSCLFGFFCSKLTCRWGSLKALRHCLESW